jgi:DNA-binding NarL/FixJ family response regulator
LSRIRILLAEGESLFREAVKVILDDQPDLDVVGAVGTGGQLVAEADRTQPDVVLLDADLPRCDVPRATRLVKERAGECKVLLLIDDGDEVFLLRGVEAGVNGFVSKSSPLEHLIDAAGRIHRGETLIPGEKLGPLLERLLQREEEQEEAYERVALLTPRQREVLALLAEGIGNGAIADALRISPETARKHVQNVLRKIHVHSRLEAAAFVMHGRRLRGLLMASRGSVRR